MTTPDDAGTTRYMNMTEEHITWGQRRDNVVSLAEDLLSRLPRRALTDGRLEYKPSAIVPLAEAILAEAKAMKPLVDQRGPRRFGSLSDADEARVVHLHMDGLINTEIAQRLGTSEGNVSSTLRRWKRGEEQGLWPSTNEPLAFCYCAYHRGDRL